MKDKTKLSDTSLIGLLNDKDITIPKYQRKFKWDTTKQRELIDSIKKDYPIGVITTYKDGEKTFILDGLQRLSTVRKFLDNPSSVFPWNKLKDYGYLDKFDENLKKSNLGNKKNRNLIRIFKDIYEQNQMFEFDRISSFMKYINKNDLKTQYILEEIEDVFYEFKNIFDIGSYRVAMITYEGDVDQVADIFEKMNTGSILLSKYEVYAASWVDFVFNDNYLSDDIIFYSNIHYKTINSTVGGLIEDLEYNDKNIAEILIGLSYKYLNQIDKDKAKKVIPKIKNETIDGNEYLSRNDIFHQILASIIEMKPNNINNVISNNKTILSSGNDDKKAFVDFIYDICEKTIIIFDDVQHEIAGIIDDNNTLDYLYYYINAVLFYVNYKVNLSNYKVEERNLHINDKNKILSELIDKNKIITEEWFKNKNRQVSFVNAKIKEAIEKIDEMV